MNFTFLNVPMMASIIGNVAKHGLFGPRIFGCFKATNLPFPFGKLSKRPIHVLTEQFYPLILTIKSIQYRQISIKETVISEKVT